MAKTGKQKTGKHGYDSITYQSAKNENGICTVIFNPNRVKVTDVMEVK